ncbi:MAG: preprotein translocase subunit SecY [Bacillaceae bacterium]|jgi:preprotein translocase subunit SecY|uniref:Protein translocase subunit SecY n=2 Tax=Aeribacillus TaxID=1055323 RepID=A0A165YBQ0_9BACI|nr:MULTISPECIES: preprotein translocase subunit SecY [Aeribacillus]AXI38671.1 preprotein translocase subunit SecY [Bacillaceae bacterium ZC4]REJ14120.1 MAG: preprotein translocase subunit SecY [Bacillaceae bacterium]KZM56398.1 preprotein translocase subunit SecY [Aeribacillus pallidus]KZN96919.1 preprotein translocase subunit SecY [Aeribacillus pallidus]MDR9793892.1 preprotein translocase subunit SecY [Aeribacillus pallidus]
MFKAISNFMRVGDIRNRILFTLLMLVIFRIGTFIPVPGVNADVLKAQDQLNVFGVLNIFGGGALQNFSILAMGIMPYITASIIVQLLQMDVVPKFTEWSKQGEVGRRKLAQFTRYLTIILGFIQALAMSYGFNNMAGGLLIINPGIGNYLLIALVLTAGTAFLMWLGEQITAKGVGNGISIIIFAGIAAGIPTAVNQIYAQQFADVGDQLFLRIVTVVLLVLAVLLVVVAVIFVQQAFRKIPIQYAKRLAGRSPVGGHSTHLPLKVNSAGVIPVIFAVSFIVTPTTIASFFGPNDVTRWIQKTFDYTQPIGMIIYVALIIAFAYFYTFVQVNPEQMAENLQKQGGYIPGIRPGKSTQEYVTKILYRLTFVGSIFLAVVSILPVFFIKFADLPSSAQIGGTSLLIVVGVALETMKQLESQLVKRHYKGFMK